MTKMNLINGFILTILLLGLGFVAGAKADFELYDFKIPHVSEPEITLLEKLESAIGPFGIIPYYFLTIISMIFFGVFFAVFYFKYPLGGIASCFVIYTYLLWWFYVNGNNKLSVVIAGVGGLIVAVLLFIKLLIIDEDEKRERIFEDEKRRRRK